MNLKEQYKEILSEKLIKIDPSMRDPNGKKFYKKDLPPTKEKPQIKPLYTGEKIKTLPLRPSDGQPDRRILPNPIEKKKRKISPFSKFTEKNREKLI
jgi:hypothetical protein